MGNSLLQSHFGIRFFADKLHIIECFCFVSVFLHQDKKWKNDSSLRRATSCYPIKVTIIIHKELILFPFILVEKWFFSPFGPYSDSIRTMRFQRKSNWTVHLIGLVLNIFNKALLHFHIKMAGLSCNCLSYSVHYVFEYRVQFKEAIIRMRWILIRKKRQKIELQFPIDNESHRKAFVKINRKLLWYWLKTIANGWIRKAVIAISDANPGNLNLFFFHFIFHNTKCRNKLVKLMRKNSFSKQKTDRNWKIWVSRKWIMRIEKILCVTNNVYLCNTMKCHVWLMFNRRKWSFSRWAWH